MGEEDRNTKILEIIEEYQEKWFIAETVPNHYTLWSSCILKVVLKSDVEVKGVTSVSKTNANECFAAFEMNKHK